MNPAHRIGVTGASGFIGRALVGKLREEGSEVVCLQRRTHGMEDEVVVGPLEDAATIPNLSVDLFVHLAAHSGAGGAGERNQAGFIQANAAATSVAIDIAHAAGARRFVLLSSVKAIREVSEPSTPLSIRTKANPTTVYGRSKLQSERLAIEKCSQLGIEWTIVRAPMVYGPGCGGNFRSLASLARSQLPLPFGSVSNARSIIFIENLVSFLEFCLASPAAADEIFFVADGEPVSTKQLLRELAEVQGRPSRLLPFPPRLLTRALAFLGQRGISDRLISDLAVDTSSARSAGWKPSFTRLEGLRITLEAQN